MSDATAGRLNIDAVKATVAACLFYASFGGLIQWFPVWLIEEKQFSGAALGQVLLWAGFARIIAGPLTSAWADGRKDRRAPIKLLAAIALLSLGALELSPSYGVSFATALALEVVSWALIAFLEAALLRLTRPGMPPTYGFARGLASLSFVVGNVACGALVDWGGNATILWWLILTFAGLLGAAFMMKAEPVVRAAEPGYTERLAEGFAMVRIVPFALLIFGCGLIQAGHQYYYLFGTKLWIDTLGISGTTAGWMFALGVIAEALFLMVIAERIRHIRPATLMLIGGIGAILRWLGMASGPDVALLVVLQLLHAVSFACTFLGAMRGIQQMWGDDRSPTAQMMFMALATAPAQALSSWLAGEVFDTGAGNLGYVSMLVPVAIGTVLVFMLWLRREQPAAA